MRNASIYAGYVHFNMKSYTGATPERVLGKHEPLITVAMAEALDAERQSRERNHSISGHTRLLTGVCSCAECGGTLHCAEDTRPKDKHTTRVRGIRHTPTVQVRET